MRPALFLALLLACFGAAAEDNAQGQQIRALGTFDEIAEQCAGDGSDATTDGYRVKLWHAYLASEGDPDASAQAIRERVGKLRQDILDDVTNDLRRQYKAARAAIPDVTRLSAAEQRQFHDLCEAPRIRGIPRL